MNYMVIEIAWSRVGKKGVYVEHSLIYYPYSVLFNAIVFFFFFSNSNQLLSQAQ